MIAVQQGEVGQMGTLFERHHARIYNFCHRMTGSQAASEDLVQEAFMRALKYRQTFRGDSDFLPWLYRLARNVCNDYFHKNQRFPVTVEELPEEVSSDPSALDTAQAEGTDLPLAAGSLASAGGTSRSADPESIRVSQLRGDRPAPGLLGGRGQGPGAPGHESAA